MRAMRSVAEVSAFNCFLSRQCNRLVDQQFRACSLFPAVICWTPHSHPWEPWTFWATTSIISVTSWTVSRPCLDIYCTVLYSSFGRFSNVALVVKCIANQKYHAKQSKQIELQECPPYIRNYWALAVRPFLLQYGKILQGLRNGNNVEGQDIRTALELEFLCLLVCHKKRLPLFAL